MIKLSKNVIIKQNMLSKNKYSKNNILIKHWYMLFKIKLKLIFINQKSIGNIIVLRSKRKLAKLVI